MVKNSLKKLLSAALATSMLVGVAPMAGAVTLSQPVALDETVIKTGTDIGKAGVVSADSSIGVTAYTGNYNFYYGINIQEPVSSMSITFNISGKVSGFLTFDSYNAEAGTYNVTWVEKSTTNLTGGGAPGKIEVGKDYVIKYAFSEVGTGKGATLTTLTVEDSEGNIVAKGTSLPLRNFGDSSNGAAGAGFDTGVIDITEIEGTTPAIKFTDFVVYTTTGADEVEVYIGDTELNATGNASIDVPALGTGDDPIVFDAIVKQADADVSADYQVVYSLAEASSDYAIDGNEFTVKGTAGGMEGGTLNPVVVVSLTDAKGSKAYSSIGKFELNINKLEATAEEYTQSYVDTLDITKDGEAIAVKNGVYQCGNSFDINSGDGIVEIEWECLMYDEDEKEWVECDAVDTKTGEYTPQAGYDGNYKLVATITHAKDSSVVETKEFECNFYDYALEVEMDAEELEIDDETDEDLDLPTVGEYGSTITWSSSNPSVITKKGSVKRASTDKEVTLTATIEKGNISVEKEFEVTVLKKKSSGSSSGGGSSSSSKSSSSVIDIVSVVNSTPVPVATPVPVSSPADSFTDLDSAEWAKPAITALANRYVINGKTATTFAPNDDITRAEFAKILISAFGLVNPNATVSGLSDVTDSSAWYYNSIASAYEKGIITGYADGSFGINDKVTRQDMAVMIYRAAKAANKTINVMKAETIFADADQIGDYAKEAVSALQRAGVINGVSDTEFAPTATATRAQAAQMVYGLIK